MKQTLRRELTNIIFLVLIVAAAVAIYLLSRGESGTAAQNIAPAATPATAPEESAEPSAAAARQETRGVPEAVFTTCLATSDLYSAERERRGERAYTLTYGEDPVVTAALRYELQNGCLSSLEFTFPLPYTTKTKGSSSIDAFLNESAEVLSGVLGDAILTLMSDLLPASDAKDELQASSVRYWVEQALLLKKVGDDFEDTQSGYRFLAYRSQGDIAQELICVLYLT